MGCGPENVGALSLPYKKWLTTLGANADCSVNASIIIPDFPSQKAISTGKPQYRLSNGVSSSPLEEGEPCLPPYEGGPGGVTGATG